MEENEVVVCQICGTYSGTAAQVRGHHMKCREREARPLDMKTPEEWEAEIKAVRAELAALQENMCAQLDELPVAERKREQPNRAERVPFGVRQKRLVTPQDPRFHEHIFNDNWRVAPTRIAQAKAAGYEIIPDCVIGPTGSNEDNTAIIGIPMRLPIELYEADQKLKQGPVEETEKAILAGTFESKLGDRGYVPEAIRIRSSVHEDQ